ncbi:hypothetical protein E2C01_028343 [Portunus trituberculatus]|uniref:Uncharacterized protein n=1 Tax=Portunus trituberculatus TaxID=210409 RepID=A0A5B7EP31_PORTR|nr:hypothetical protein [Portunus trituberculatus]
MHEEFGQKKNGSKHKDVPKKTVRVNTAGDLLLCCFTNIRWTPGGSTVLLKLVCPSDPLRLRQLHIASVKPSSRPAAAEPSLSESGGELQRPTRALHTFRTLSQNNAGMNSCGAKVKVV